MSEVAKEVSTTTKGSAKIVYILYMVGVMFGLTGIIGVIMAYINKDSAPEWLKTHYQFQIRTFWIGGLFLITGWILSVVLIGWLVILFWVIWLIVRSIKGIKALELENAIENPKRWLF
jgi:uncharacterized membrane protein